MIVSFETRMFGRSFKLLNWAKLRIPFISSVNSGFPCREFNYNLLTVPKLGLGNARKSFGLFITIDLLSFASIEIPRCT